MIQCIKKGKSFIALDDNNQEAGNITWFDVGDNVINIDHTFVDEAYRGQGIAGQLLQCAIKMAKANGLKIIPSCSYVAKALKHDEKYKDLLA